MKKVIAFVLSILVTLIGCQNGSKEKNEIRITYASLR